MKLIQLLSSTRHISSLFIQLEFQICKFRGKSSHGVCRSEKFRGASSESFSHMDFSTVSSVLSSGLTPWNLRRTWEPGGKNQGDALRRTVTSSEVGETGWSHFLTTSSLMFGFLQTRCWTAHGATRMKMLQVGNNPQVGSERRGVLGTLGLHLLVWRLRKVDVKWEEMLKYG